VFHLLFSTPFSTPEKEGGTFTTTDELPITTSLRLHLLH
jgi:hypothetical protein